MEDNFSFIMRKSIPYCTILYGVDTQDTHSLTTELCSVHKAIRSYLNRLSVLSVLDVMSLSAPSSVVSYGLSRAWRHLPVLSVTGCQELGCTFQCCRLQVVKSFPAPSSVVSYGLSRAWLHLPVLSATGCQELACTFQHCQLRVVKSMPAPHCKKRLSFFPSLAGMSLAKLSLAGNNLIIPGQGEFG
jgi:hypothetical protein